MSQSEEITTIRERDITLNLSDADVKRICEKAGSVGLTVAELLQNFIGDLTDGTYSNGSDERLFAERWFDRCWFAMDTIYDDTFLKYLLEMDMVEEITDAWQELKRYEADAKVQEEARDICEDEQNFINETFAEYVEDRISPDNEAPKLEDEMATVLKWWNEYQQISTKNSANVEKLIEQLGENLVSIRKVPTGEGIIWAVDTTIEPDFCFTSSDLKTALIKAKIALPGKK